MKFTSEDLLKAMGLKVGDIVTTNFYKYKFIITESDNYLVLIDNDGDYWPFELLIKNDYEIIQPKPILTEDEKVILRNLPKEYKWIARDSIGYGNHLWIYGTKPTRISKTFSLEKIYKKIDLFDNIFKFIKWEDKPYLIEELLKE